MAEQIIIEFIGDASKLAPAVDVLEQLGQIDAKAAQSFRNSNIELAKRETTLKKVSSEGQKQIKTFKDVEKAVDSLATSFMEGFQDGILEVLAETGTSIDDLKKTLGGLKQTTDQNTNAQDSLKKQLKDLTAQLSLLELQGKRNTTQYQELVNKAGELKDSIADANDAIANAGSDTRGVDNLIQLAGGVAGGFAIAQGAAALFGDESEELQKTLLKVNAAMAILQGWQQISDIMSKRQFQSLGALIGAQRIQNAQLAIENGLQSKSVVVRGLATAAQKALNAAMSVNPLVLLIIAITAVVAAFKIFGSEAEKTKDATEELTKAIEKQTDSYGRLNDEIDFNIKKEIALAKIRGESAGSIDKIEQKGFEQRYKNAQDFYEKSIDLVNETSKKIADEIAKSGKIGGGFLTKKQVEDVRKNIGDISIIEQHGNEKQKERLKIALDDNKKYAQESVSAFKDLELKKLDVQGNAAQKQRELQKKYSDQAKANAEKDAQAFFEINQRRLEREQALLKSIADNEPSDLKVRLLALEKYNTSVNNLLELQRNKELAAKNLTQAQIQNINDKYDKLALDKLREFGVYRLNIIKQSNENEQAEHLKRLEQYQKDEEAYNDIPVSNINDMFKKLAENEAKAQAERLKGAEQRYKQGITSLVEYESERNRIIKEGAKTELENELAKINALIAIKKAQGSDISDLIKSQQAIEEQIRQADLDNYRSHEEEKTKIVEEEQAVRNEIFKASLGIFKEFSDAFFEADAENRQAALDAAIKQLEDFKAKELDNKNLTEQQKADIDKKYQEKIRQLKRKDAEEEKKAKIAQAAINGALAITNILATRPKFDLGIGDAIMIAAALASTAIQIGKIKSTPLPQFKAGTKNAPSGYALVGEEGPEIVKLAGGEKIYKYKDSMKIADAWRGGSVATADEILAMGGKLPSVNQSIISNSYVNGNVKLSIDYDKLGQAVASKLPAPVLNNIMMDENGFTKYISQQGNKLTIKNSRYKF